MKYNKIRIEPFGYEVEVSSKKLAAFNKRLITEDSFKKLGVPMDSFTFERITGMSISPPYNKNDMYTL